MPASGFFTKLFDIFSAEKKQKHFTSARHAGPSILAQKLDSLYVQHILTIAKLLSANHPEVISRIQMCSAEDVRPYLLRYKELLLDRRCIEKHAENKYALRIPRDTLLWFALIDALIDANCATYTNWDASYEDIVLNLRAVFAHYKLAYPENTTEQLHERLMATEALKEIQSNLAAPYTVGVLSADTNECDFVIAPHEAMQQAKGIAQKIGKKIIIYTE